MLIELIPLFMFAAICIFLMLGYPVAFTLGGVALAFAALGIVGGIFDPNLLKSFPSRLYGIMNNYTLVAVRHNLRDGNTRSNYSAVNRISIIRRCSLQRLSASTTKARRV
jgi:TRAP-type mannitol/chloroaromatic compound transport system permease large subunit